MGLSGMGWGVLSGRGGAGGVSRGFQTVGEATRVPDGGGGIGHGVVVEASLRQTDSGHGAGSRESGQAGQAVPHVVQDPGVAWPHGGRKTSGWRHPQAGGRRELTDEGVRVQISSVPAQSSCFIFKTILVTDFNSPRITSVVFHDLITHIVIASGNPSV